MSKDNLRVGKDCFIADGCLLGLPSREYRGTPADKLPPTIIGDRAVIREGTIIYCDVEVGSDFQTGHNVLIREKTTIGDSVLIGSSSIVEGKTTIGKRTSIQSMVYIPTDTIIEERVFIGPNAVLANDKYPIRINEGLVGPRLRRGCTIGGNATILPGVEIGEGAFVAAGSVVTKDVAPWMLAKGCPAQTSRLPERLKVLNFSEVR